MARRKLVEVVRYLHKLAGPGAVGGLTDDQLLERYVVHQDEAAFELLLWRHGALVLNVCRRILHHEQDAEDAFQATFLTFVRKARSITRRGAVAGWLYKVAYRVALAARARSLARRQRPDADRLAAPDPPDPAWSDLGPVLDEEVNRLPRRLRLPFVLCYLEGKTNEEAARQLGCPPGTVYSRLARGREILRARLLRRGVTLSAGLLTSLVCRNAARAAPVASLVDSTLEAALRFAGGRASGAASVQVVALAEGVLQAMFFTKLRIAAVVLVVLGALAAGGVLTHQALRAEQRPPAKPEELLPAPPVARKAEPKAIKVQVVKPTPGGTERMTTQPGTVRAYEQQQVYAAISGHVKETPVDIGDHVKKGQVLAVIDAPILVTEMEQAAAALQLAKGQVEEAAARVVAAEAELKAAQAKEEQVRAALQRGQVTAIEATTARSDVTVKESKIRQARATLTIAQAGTKMAQAALDKARLQVGFTRLLSSYDGVVTRRTVNVGDYIQPGEPGRRVPLLTVQRVDMMRVVVQIPDRDVPITEPGAPVEIKFDALPGQQFSAKVSRIGFAEDEATRTMPVEIDVPNPKGQVRPGMFGTVTVHLKAPPGAVRIPNSCLIFSSSRGRYSVYVVHDGKAHRTQVYRGNFSKEAGNVQMVEILAGLKPSDRVVSNPLNLTGDILPVEVKDAP